MNNLSLSIAHKISLLTLILIIVTSSILGFFLIERSTNVLIEGALDEIHRDIVGHENSLTQHISSIKEDVVVLSKLNSLQQLLQLNQHKSLAQESGRQAVINDFTAIMEAKPTYLHIRYIDATGQEIVRVDRKTRGSAVYTIPKSELQNKLQRDFVQNTFKLPAGKVYISDIQLYKEHGVIVEPHQIGSRVSMPIYDEINNQLLGMVIINFEVGSFLAQLQSSHNKRNQQMFITNHQGDYLYHPDPDKRFGFMLGKRFRLQDDVPETQSFFDQKQPPNDFRLIKKIGDQRYVYVINSMNIDAGNTDHSIMISVRQAYDDIVEEQRAVHKESLYWGALVVLIGLGIALIFARRLSYPLEQMTSIVDKYTHDNKTTLKLPTKRNDELGILARSFQSMIKRIEISQRALKELNAVLEKRVDERTQELSDSEALQKAILSSMFDAVITTFDNGKIKGVNRAAIVMFDATENTMLNTPICHILKKDNDEDTIMYTGYRADGSHFPAEVTKSEGMYGERRIYTSIIHDITEKLAIDKLKTEFVSTVSHELRTPLTAIKGSLELMSRDVLGDMPDKVKPVLKIACNNTDRLLHIINDLLDIQKIAEGKMEYHFKTMSVASLLHKAVESNQAYANQYSVIFSITKNIANNIKVYADDNRMMQVLSNLLSNAAKFSHEGGHVEIAASLKDKVVCLSITDHGCGIPESFRPRMFSKFSQADSSDTRKKGGSGLGLVVTKSIVEDHHGEIEYTSKQGVGTTFYVKIPQQIISP